MFVSQKVPLSKIYDDDIACDLWFGPPQSKNLTKPMVTYKNNNDWKCFFSGKETKSAQFKKIISIPKSFYTPLSTK